MYSSFHKSIIRAYDIRGIVSDTLHVKDAYLLGRKFANDIFEKFRNLRIVVGYDGRLSSPTLEKELILGLKDGGAEVTRIGLCPSPMLYFASKTLDSDGAIMITGSHNPAQYNGFKILSSFTKTQSIHQQYGGVVPEIASREHEKYLPSITKKVLEDANKSFKDIDAIAVTNGPGLMGSLLSGISFAKGISQALNIPIIPINHLEAHLNSVFIEHAELEAPFINLLVSGGHTQLWLVKNMFEYELLGETLDDACGEAFDKGAKKMNLNYPGGPEIEKLAKNGNMNLINFPRPMINDNTFNFSFSGLKTALIIRR